jgi:hypothetical protein
MDMGCRMKLTMSVNKQYADRGNLPAGLPDVGPNPHVTLLVSGQFYWPASHRSTLIRPSRARTHGVQRAWLIVRIENPQRH